ncbi:hypothetical protein [Enterovibrio coralii]|uniref:Uncharacterized protein n=1 Tax=Enterovibrio coralii TaxID=294935 RepID=A0A135IDF2_9GAMM|nr:hypothetical protein [Enterovibrio coralii]KXF83364.1 hypothetical protein ATN88_06805 [Enterovibrio coralii]
MKQYIVMGLLLVASIANATSNDDHAEDKAQIRALLEQLYTDGQNPNLSTGEYLQRYFLPKSLKQLQVVSGPNGERKKWER